MTDRLQKLSISSSLSIMDAMRAMNDAAEKTLFVVDEDKKLLGVISDGNIRRHIIKRGSLDGEVSECMNTSPFCLMEGYDVHEAKNLFLNNKIEVLPVLDKDNTLVDVCIWSEILGDQEMHYDPVDSHVVIMAGGKGSRLDPFTRILPKPLIPIGDMTILEMIMSRFARHGIRKFFVTINHKAHILKAYFKEKETGYDLSWVEEENPNGTAGSLSMLAGQLDGTVIISNCDILVDAHYDEVVAYHKEHGCDITMVAAMNHYQMPYGVCEIDEGGRLTSLKEKPHFDQLVNVGLYVINSDILDRIPTDRYYDFTTLIDDVRADGGHIGVYPVDANAWVDVGQWAEYRKAVSSLGDTAFTNLVD